MEPSTASRVVGNRKRLWASSGRRMPVAVKELCRTHGFSGGNDFFGGASAAACVCDAERRKELEVENTRLKKLLADSLLETRPPVKRSAEKLWPHPRAASW